MAVRYKLVKRKDLSKNAAQGAQKFYASVNNNGTMSFKQMCEAIAAYSTASRGDVLLVLDGLLFCMKESLLRGEIVQMGDFGNFQLNVGSSGTDTPDAFKADMIRKPRIVFRPGEMLKDMLLKVSFERIGKEPASSSGGGNDRPDEV